MASTSSEGTGGPGSGERSGSPSLRVRGVVILVLLIGEVLVGNELALAGSPYPVVLLAAHVLLSLVLVGFTGHALRLAVRRPRTAARALAGVLTFLSTVGATVSGTVFLLAGQGQPALSGMEGLAIVALLGSILLIVWGSTPANRNPPAPSPGGSGSGLA